MAENHTRSNIPLKPLYTPEDIKSLDYDTHLNEVIRHCFFKEGR